MVRHAFNHYSTMRSDMVDETTRFLSWALRNYHLFPRIPRVRVDSGIRFSDRIKVAFWSTALLDMNEVNLPWDEEKPRQTC